MKIRLERRKITKWWSSALYESVLLYSKWFDIQRMPQCNVEDKEGKLWVVTTDIKLKETK